MRTTISMVAAAALAATLAGCGASAPSTKAGGAKPVTLRIATADSAETPTADLIKEFVRQVDKRGDHVRVEPVWEAVGPDRDDWDQQAARKVIAGEIELGAIPARSWDTEGVASFRAVQAPFLVTSEKLVERIVTDRIAEQMLAELEPVGVVGLSLVPEAFRHPFAYGKPMRGPADYAGAVVASPRSDQSYRMFTALGAHPDDPSGEAFDIAVQNGEIAAADSEFLWGHRLPAKTVATGNVTYYPKLVPIVANLKAWQQLAGDQQDVLREAAKAVRDWAAKEILPDAAAAKKYCERGGTVVLASAADIAALERAARPVYAELENDPQTKAYLDQIRALKAATPTDADAPTPCGQ